MLWTKQKVSLRVPQVGEKVWWAPKGLGCLVTHAGNGLVFQFQGGETIKNKKGRQVPRWTVQAKLGAATWDNILGMWIVGQGKTPKLVRGTIITPDPVAMSGKSTGSFAVTNKGGSN